MPDDTVRPAAGVATAEPIAATYEAAALALGRALGDLFPRHPAEERKRKARRKERKQQSGRRGKGSIAPKPAPRRVTFPQDARPAAYRKSLRRKYGVFAPLMYPPVTFTAEQHAAIQSRIERDETADAQRIILDRLAYLDEGSERYSDGNQPHT